MASFTDNPQALGTFNPYVQQLPVEAMVKVGMEKQKQYNEGIQKIQTSIDNIAGLDIAKDSDKAYLQSKVNELGNNLKFVAAGDFSDFQLVNSVNGMTGQLVKDNRVQNAVSSTAKYRKELSVMEEAKKKGELTPDNKYVFDKKAGEWLNSSEIGESFNASYTPYFDVFKFTKETFDAVKPDGYSYDQIFETDAAGNPKVDSKGRPILSTTMVRLEKEGVFPDKVKATLAQVFSDPRVSQQLNISGQYNYRGLDSKALEEKISVQREDVMAGFAEQLMDLNLKKSMGENVDDQIDALQSQLNKTSTSYDELAQLAYDNPDGVKGMLYKDDVSSKYTTMFGWSKTKSQTLDNPAWKAEFDMQKEANAERRWASEQSYKRERDIVGDSKWQAEYEQRERLAGAKKKPVAGGEPNPGEAAPESAAYNEIIAHDNELQTATANYTNSSNAFIWQTVLSKEPGMIEAVNKYIDSSTKPRAEAQAEAIEMLIKNGAARQKMSPEAFRATWINKAKEKYNTPGSKPEPNIKDLYQNYRKANKEYEAVLVVDKQIQTRSKAELGEVVNKLATMDIPTKRIKIGDKTYDLTKEDMFDIALANEGGASIWQTLSSSADAKVLDSEAAAAKARLLKKGKGALLDAYANDNRGFWSLSTSGMVNVNSNLWSGVKTIGNLISDKQFKEGLSKKADIIRNAYGKNPNKSFSVASGDAETDKATFANIKRMAGMYSTNDLGNVSGDFKKFGTSLGKNMEDSNLEYRVTYDEYNNPAVEIISYGEDGRAGGMTITPDQARTLGINIDEISESREVTTTRNIINNSPRFSTSAGDPEKIGTYISGDSRFDNNDFPNMNRTKFEVQSNIIFDSSVGKYYPYLYMRDASTRNPGMVRQLAGSEDLSTVINTLKQTVSPTLVQTYLLQNNAR
jgi:hypothetical protein